MGASKDAESGVSVTAGVEGGVPLLVVVVVVAMGEEEVAAAVEGEGVRELREEEVMTAVVGVVDEGLPPAVWSAEGEGLEDFKSVSSESLVVLGVSGLVLLVGARDLGQLSPSNNPLLSSDGLFSIL